MNVCIFNLQIYSVVVASSCFYFEAGWIVEEDGTTY
jgi:hypothetical protein